MSLTETSRKDADSRSRTARFTHWLRKTQIGWIVAAAVVLAVVLQFRDVEGPRPAKAVTAKPQAVGDRLPVVGHPQHDVMALVNGQDISRQALTNTCIQLHGEDVLESLVNKRLILNHCEKRGIAITPNDINAEIDRMAKRFKMGRQQWFELLERERGISPQEYARDIVWPTLALRKLAVSDLEVSPEEVQQEFEHQYGEMIQARLIAVGSIELAEKLHAQLTAEPDKFARLAIEHSIDINSASVGGLIQPIRRHVGDETIEREAFSLQKGQVSSILPVAEQFVILKCEGRIPPRNVDRAKVEPQIVENIKDEKLRDVAQTLFAQLQTTATIQNVYNNPRLRQTMPGVVATVNGDRITTKELGQECLLRHGKEVLENEISRLLLEQSIKAAGFQVTEADLEAEVRHAAELAGMVDANGQVDLSQWFATVTEQQSISKSQYLKTAVWPSAALKKLTARQVQVTEEDLNKGFTANYGERVRCRAIVLGTMRRAQEVWDKARRNPSVEYFSDLAEEYSIEPTSKSLRGEVPPIQRFGGQPQLEQAAFGLEPGQLSGIVQLGDKFLILRCEGRTERIDVDQAEVHDILYRDIYEKKLRLAMSEKFESIREHSRVDNYLAGTSHAPTSHAKLRRDAAVRPTAGQH
ncbi:MAG: peptidylprolyl isomerase [Planctomycetes bacterium]|nr:peptidylprolyl isomerase [Planctomycetota bacterium]